jgi:hypothetical protein
MSSMVERTCCWRARAGVGRVIVRTLVIPSSVFSSIEDMIDALSDVFASANTSWNDWIEVGRTECEALLRRGLRMRFSDLEGTKQRFVSQQLRNKVGGRSDFLHREEIFVFSVNGNRDSRAQSVEIEL